jgi:DNA repair photolyase
MGIYDMNIIPDSNADVVAVGRQSANNKPPDWEPTPVMGPPIEPTPASEVNREPVGFWPNSLVIALNDFKYKSLSNFACNTTIGCIHGCIFCSVPSTSVIKQKPKLAEYGVTDPDGEWGNYALLRPWDEKKFMASLKRAEAIPMSDLKPDGNRAVIFCSVTDAYQTFRASTPALSKLLNESSEAIVRKALVAIRDHSSLNVRILTRSPLARRDFGLFNTFGNRLVFGMSLPTLDNNLARIYEPNAPAPSRRLETLREAKATGLHVYVAMAPTYPECDEDDLRRTLTAIKELGPITIFHEPINIRAQNVARIAQHAKDLGVTLNTAVFDTRQAWREYALGSLTLVQRLATELGLLHCLHLWPDQDLEDKGPFLKLRESQRANLQLTKHQQNQHTQQDEHIYKSEYLPWLNGWWDRISEWPGKQ